MVTDDFPLQHTHHHGIWFPWTNARFQERKPDFWNMGGGTGRVDFVKLDKAWSGPVHGGFRAVHRFDDLTVKPAKAVLQETWEVRVYALTGGARPKWILISPARRPAPAIALDPAAVSIRRPRRSRKSRGITRRITRPGSSQPPASATANRPTPRGRAGVIWVARWRARRRGWQSSGTRIISAHRSQCGYIRRSRFSISHRNNSAIWPSNPTGLT